MARSHAKIHADIWQDTDFLALTGDAQRLYLVILGQPKMNLAGTIDLKLERWTSFCADWTSDRTTLALGELEAARFVLVDRLSEEATIRTFIKNDVVTGRWNSNTAKGVWSAWKAVESARLKAEIVHAIPDDVWTEKLEEYAPEHAHRIRSEPPPEPPCTTKGPNQPIGPTDGTNSSDGQTEPPSPSPSPEPSPTPPPPVGPDQPSDPPAPTPPPAAATEIDRTRRFHEAIDLLVDHHIARNPSKAPGPHRRSVTRGKRADHADAAMEHLAADPTLTPDQLAQLLEPNGSAPPPPDPAELHRQALDAEAERNAARARGDACPRCAGSRILDAELLADGSWGPVQPCPDCTSPDTQHVQAAITGRHLHPVEDPTR